jgi:hypothetical protein
MSHALPSLLESSCYNIFVSYVQQISAFGQSEVTPPYSTPLPPLPPDRCFSTYKPHAPSEDPICITIPVSASRQAVEYTYWFSNLFIHMDESERSGFALFHVRYLFPVTSKRGLRAVKRLHSRLYVLSLFRPRYGPGIDSTSNRNEYILWVTAACE